MEILSPGQALKLLFAHPGPVLSAIWRGLFEDEPDEARLSAAQARLDSTAATIKEMEISDLHATWQAKYGVSLQIDRVNDATIFSP